jgi:hypothetical protein
MATIRFKAQFDDLMLKCQSVSGSGSVSYQKSEYAGIDGAEFDNLGLNGRTFSVSAVFFNDTYDDYQLFLDRIREPDTVHNFVHPDFGLIFGVVTRWNERVDSRRKCIEVDFVFEEQEQGDFESRITPLIQPQIEELFQTGQQESIDAFKSRISASLGSSAMALLSRATVTTISFSSQFTDLSRTVRSFVADADRAYDIVQSFAATVTQPINTIVSNIDYGTTLPGRFIGAIAQAVDRYATLIRTTATAPYLVLQSFFSGLNALRNELPGFLGEFDAVRSQAGAVLCSDLFASDDENRAVAAEIDKIPSWTNSGEFIKKDPRPDVITTNELERMISIVRANLQLAIDSDRGSTVFHIMAATLLRHVDSIKIKRERVITIDVPTSIPLALLCHSRGLGYGSVDRVLALNPQISDPSFVSGSISIYDR